MMGGKGGPLRGNARLQLVVASALTFFAATLGLGPAVAADDEPLWAAAAEGAEVDVEADEGLGFCSSNKCCTNTQCPSTGYYSSTPVYCSGASSNCKTYSSPFSPYCNGYCQASSCDTGLCCSNYQCSSNEYCTKYYPGGCYCKGYPKINVGTCESIPSNAPSGHRCRYDHQCASGDCFQIYPPNYALCSCTADSDCDSGYYCNQDGAYGYCTQCPYCLYGTDCTACENDSTKLFCGMDDAHVQSTLCTASTFDATTRPLSMAYTSEEEVKKEVDEAATDVDVDVAVTATAASGNEWEYYGMTFHLEATNLCSIGDQAAIEAAVMARLQDNAIDTVDRSVTYTTMTLTSGCGVNEAADSSSSVAVSESRRDRVLEETTSSYTTFQTYGYCRYCRTTGLPGASINYPTTSIKSSSTGADAVVRAESEASLSTVTYDEFSIVNKVSSGTRSEATWYDSGGPTYNCAKYGSRHSSGSYPYCDWWGHSYRNFGMTANEACTVCGGGSSSGSTTKSRARMPNEEDVLTLLQNNKKLNDASAAAIKSNLRSASYHQDGPTSPPLGTTNHTIDNCTSDEDCGHPDSVCNPCDWADGAHVCLPVNVPHGEVCSCDAECTSGTCHTELEVPICA